MSRATADPSASPRSRPRGSAAALAARIVLVAGLVADAIIHLHLASTYDAVRSSTISQGDLFRVEAVVAAVAALAVLILPRPLVVLVALLIALSAAGAAIGYRYLQIPAVGPIPSMYEPTWYAEKAFSVVAELAAAVAAVAWLVVSRRTPTAPEAATD